MTQPKGTARIAVEAVLRGLTADCPMSAERIAEVAGVDIGQARNYISYNIAVGDCHAVNAPRRPALYAYGPAPVREPVNAQRTAPSEFYSGHDLKKEPPRGAPSLHAFTLGSVINGEWRARTGPPMLMASSASTNQNARPL